MQNDFAKHHTQLEYAVQFSHDRFSREQFFETGSVKEKQN